MNLTATEAMHLAEVSHTWDIPGKLLPVPIPSACADVKVSCTDHLQPNLFCVQVWQTSVTELLSRSWPPTQYSSALPSHRLRRNLA